MSIDYRNGDMLKSGIRHVVQGCNAQGVMGSGVAKTLRDLYPQNYEAYRQTYVRQGNKLNLGQIIWVDCGAHVVGDLISQEFYGRDAHKGTVYVDYKAIERGIELIDARFEGRKELMKLLRDTLVDAYAGEVALADPDEPPFDMNEPIGLEEVAFPLIGAGLAGGSWRTISGIIEQARHFQPVVFLFDGVMPQS